MSEAGKPTDGGSGQFTERILASGHRNVTGTHETTFEITTDDYLTPAGDCILAIEADRAPADFDPAFVAACRDTDATITVTLSVRPGPGASPLQTTVVGRGDPELSFESDRGTVARRSTYVDGRTVVVEAEAAAEDIDRTMIDALATGGDVELKLAVDPPE